MKNVFILFTLFLALVSCAPKEKDPFVTKKAPVNIIPKPVEMIHNNGSFQFTGDISLNLNFNRPEIQMYAEEFFGQLAKNEKLNFQGGAKKNINFSLIQNDDLGEEGYQMNVTKETVNVIANNDAGLFYALQTLRQMLPTDAFSNPKRHLYIAQVELKDKPRFGWRGMLLDCCRHFMEKDFVKRYIDLLAYHKMNRFHWHLTEDQGWRIEIKKYPKLTEISSYRTEKDGSKYGGFYTQEDIKEVVAYATSRNIMVIPEIEMPGHSLAALAAYPELSCTGGPFEVGNKWGVFKDIYCAGNEKTFEFLEGVLDEVVELFPAPYVHIGGDEAPKYRWENCEKSQQRMKDEGLHDEHELQSYFITRMEKYLNSKGKSIIGWEEILEGGLAPNATVQAWLSMESGVKAAKEGHYAIMSPTSHCYFDYDIKTTNLEKVYDFEPVSENLTEEESKYILGGECNMWTEHAPQEKIDAKVFPRILALSEVLWSPVKGREFSEFIGRVQNHYDLLDEWGVNYGFENDPVMFIANIKEDNTLSVEMKTAQKGLEIRYTSDGSEPSGKSGLYDKPLALDKSSTIRAIALKDGKIVGDIFGEKYAISKSLGKEVSHTNGYHRNYTGGGKNALTNGVEGGNNFRDGRWQGFEGADMEVVVDLGSEMEISKIRSTYLQHNLAWIFAPVHVRYSASLDGKEYKEIVNLESKTDKQSEEEFLETFSTDFTSIKARYIKVFAKSVGKCPPEHPGAGGKAWVFADEIVIE